MGSVRLAAWRILRSGSTTPLREVDRLATAWGLDKRDRALLRALVGTEVRRRATLRAIVERFTRGKPSADVAAHLRLGAAQLLFLDRIPDHAAVSETVSACRDTVNLPRSRYVNAVLRTLLRARRAGSAGDAQRDVLGSRWHLEEPVFRDPEEHPLLWGEDALSVPAALLKRWSKRYGWERARELARQALDPPPLSLVVLAGERAALAAELAGEGVETRKGRHPRVLLAESRVTEAVVASPAFLEGRLTIQGETALRAAELVGAVEGERVLDLCAAPGGKTVILAQSGARVLAVDSNPTRLARLTPNLERIPPASPVHALACDGTAALAQGQLFDAVLLDAPCTNTGVLAARPGARWRFGPGSLREVVALQARLLREAAARVRPGGRLVYSTCSIEPEEGRRQIGAFLQESAGWTLREERDVLPGGLESAGPIDGGYAARIEVGLDGNSPR